MFHETPGVAVPIRLGNQGGGTQTLPRGLVGYGLRLNDLQGNARMLMRVDDAGEPSIHAGRKRKRRLACTRRRRHRRTGASAVAGRGRRMGLRRLRLWHTFSFGPTTALRRAWTSVMRDWIGDVKALRAESAGRHI